MPRGNKKGYIPEAVKPYQWKKGQSGNPKGRTPKTKYIPELLDAIGQEQVEAGGMSKLEAILRKVYKYAFDGHSWAVQFIADRTEGKPKEYIEQSISMMDQMSDEEIEQEIKRLNDIAESAKAGKRTKKSASLGAK